jgi:hypothetical protein
MLLRELFRPFPKKLAKVPAGRLLVWGAVAGREHSFGPEDLRVLAADLQVDDVAHYKAGATGRAVRLAGLLAACAPKSGSLYLNAASRDGSKVCSYWLNEVQPLAWIVYEDEQRALSGGDAGPFQLVVPGLAGPRGAIRDLALIEIGTQSEDERLESAIRAAS